MWIYFGPRECLDVSFTIPEALFHKNVIDLAAFPVPWALPCIQPWFPFLNHAFVTTRSYWLQKLMSILLVSFLLPHCLWLLLPQRSEVSSHNDIQLVFSFLMYYIFKTWFLGHFYNLVYIIPRKSLKHDSAVIFKDFLLRSSQILKHHFAIV